MRDALGPFLDGDLQEGNRVNVQTGRRSVNQWYDHRC